MTSLPADAVGRGSPVPTGSDSPEPRHTSARRYVPCYCPGAPTSCGPCDCAVQRPSPRTVEFVEERCMQFVSCVGRGLGHRALQFRKRHFVLPLLQALLVRKVVPVVGVVRVACGRGGPKW